MIEWKDKLRKMIFDKGFKSIQEFARVSGIPRGSIFKYLNHHCKTIKEENLEKMSKTLGVDIDELRPYKVKKIDFIPANTFECLNEKCLLNHCKQCLSDAVVEGRGSCMSKNVVSSKRIKSIEEKQHIHLNLKSYIEYKERGKLC